MSLNESFIFKIFSVVRDSTGLQLRIISCIYLRMECNQTIYELMFFKFSECFRLFESIKLESVE